MQAQIPPEASDWLVAWTPEASQTKNTNFFFCLFLRWSLSFSPDKGSIWVLFWDGLSMRVQTAPSAVLKPQQQKQQKEKHGAIGLI